MILMPSRPMAIVIIFSLLMCSVSGYQFRLLHTVCGSNGNYTSDSIYEKNLDTALANLYTAANTSNSGFYHTTVGEDSDRVNTLMLCRSDVQPDVCRGCVKESIDRLRNLCPREKEAVEWYNECMLRYSHDTILNNLVTEPSREYLNTKNATDVVQFNKDLRTLLDDLKGKVIQQKFATGNISGPDFLTIFGLMQCTPDLSSAQCSDCINLAIRDISTCCSGKLGGQLIKPSCRLWFEDERFYNDTITVDALALPAPGKDDNATRKVVIAVVIVGVALFLLILFCIFRRKKKQRSAPRTFLNENAESISSGESMQYDFATIEVATNFFLDSNKLGEGGFGAVYKGVLKSGQEVAVKRLSRGSNQGEEEFKNEVLLVAQLQHRNLVRLFGFCYKGTERLLIYEFVPNASLDHFIFDSTKRSFLDWKKRYKIIRGISRGLLYLHEDSRLRIVHRDLKASNVLLDADYNPKIADFGTARLFDIDETQGNTSRIVGTYGYMAPEYAMYGQFSVKSDVFSFGLLVLEIVSGQKNNSFRNGETVEDLASSAWKNWQEGSAINVIDSVLKNTSESIREMIRCIHIGLLCVQEDVAERPDMALVVLMLSSSSLTLAVPSEPAFFMHDNIDPEVSLPELDTTNSTAADRSSKAKDKSFGNYSPDNSLSTEYYPR